MSGLNGMVSQLLAAGHVDAKKYTIGEVWEENQLVVDRLNRQYATLATVMHSVMTAGVASFGNKGREANAALQKLIKELNGDG